MTMTTSSKKLADAGKPQDHATATIMMAPAASRDDLPLMAAQDDLFIDFDAKQEGIGTTRRSAGEAHTVRRRTRAKPSDAEATEI
jgi:hypothetical protein